MNQFLALVTLFICFPTINYGQSSVPSMILIQNGTINYDYYKDSKQGNRATDFHINQYVEANFQYQQYLKYLAANSLDSLFELAQPNLEIWDDVDISAEQIAYLKTHYWTHQDFASYPVLGLNYVQITNYLKWKTERISYAYLLKTKKIKSKNSPYQPFSLQDYLKENPKFQNKIPAYFALPRIIFETIAFNHSGNGKLPQVKAKSFEKWLQKHTEFKFLAFQPDESLQKTALQQKLFEIGIKSIAHTDLTKILTYKNKTAYYELVGNLPYSSVEGLKSYTVCSTEEEWNRVQKNPEKFNPPHLRRTVKDILMIQPKSNYGQFGGIKKQEKYSPLMAFRGVSLDKRTLIIVKER